MKKRIHKNQVVITSLAVLIAIAGYVSYDKTAIKNEKTQEVANTDLLGSMDNYDTDVTDEQLQELSASDVQEGEELLAEASTEEDLNPGETVLTSAGVEPSDYAASVKLSREQVRSKNRETLQQIIDNESLEQEQKQAAVNEMIALTDVAEKEANAEMMLEAKGFANAVVSISEDSCDVVVAMDGASEADRAKVEDIVKRKTGVPAENIVITPMETD